MESVPRASVDISTEEKPAPAAGAKNFTLSLNKKVVYGLGLVAIVALGALGVASVSQDGTCDECMMACNPDDGTAGTEDYGPGPGTEDDGTEDYGPGPDGESRRRFLQGGPEAGANDPYGDCTNACMAPGGACDDGTAGTEDYGPGPDGGLCAPGCFDGWQGDNYCDEACYVEACNFDNGDCDGGDGEDPNFNGDYGPGPQDGENCAPGCYDGWQGDNYCDQDCNNEACNFDDGDCAAGTEDSGEDGGYDYGPGPGGDCDCGDGESRRRFLQGGDCDCGTAGTEDYGPGPEDYGPGPEDYGPGPEDYGPGPGTEDDGTEDYGPAPWDDGTAGTDGGRGEDCAPGCYNGWQGDNYCDEACMNEACNFDNGDCDGGDGESR